MSAYINILASGCFFDASGALIQNGTLTVTPSSSFSIDGIGQFLGESMKRPIVNGSLAQPLQLADPSQTNPQGIGYTFVVTDARGYTMPYNNVLISPDNNDAYDLALLNRGLFETAVPKTVISLSGADTGGTGSGNTVVVTAGATAISLYTVVALLAGVAVLATSGNMATYGQVIGIAVQTGGVGNPFAVQYAGEVDFAGWNWTPNQPVFVGPSGNLTQTPSGIGFIQCLGIAKTTTAVLLSVQPPIAIQ